MHCLFFFWWFESPLQPGTASPATLSVTIPSFGVTKHISSEGLIKDDWKINIKSFVIFYLPHPSPESRVCSENSPFAPFWILNVPI